MANQPSRSPGDLIINGIGGGAPGLYRKVDINGLGTINGDIECDSLRSNGRVKSRGSMKTNHFDCDGMLRIEGDLQAQDMRIDGMLKVIGAMTGEKLHANGMVSIGGDCELEFCSLKGGFKIGGLLNAGRLELDVGARCQAREIGGETIHVRRRSQKWSNMWKWLFPSFTAELHANVIEGDDIELEGTTAAVVRGKRIIVGKGCTIGRVEYSGELRVLPGASVGEEIHTNGNSNFA